MPELALDMSIYDEPIRPIKDPHEKSPAKLMGRRETLICQRCPIPHDCHMHNIECPLSAVISKSATHTSPQRRINIAEHYRSRILRRLENGSQTCEQIAAALECETKPIYIAISSLIMDAGENILPDGQLNGKTRYMLAAKNPANHPRTAT